MVHTTLITGPERRRRWSEDQKLTVLSAAFAPGARVAEVARRADVCTSLIYRWRRDFAAEAPAGFAPAVLTDGRVGRRREASGSTAAIIVDMACGDRVTIQSGAEAATIAATLRALR